jgi:hypothetical protein
MKENFVQDESRDENCSSSNSSTVSDGKDNKEFKKRMNSIFGSLSSLETEHTQRMAQLGSPNTNNKQNASDLLETNKQNRSEEFKFKAPLSAPIKRTNSGRPKLPDHVLNPQKWTKYSLEDVDESQMSSSANYNAAMHFLHQSKVGLKDVEMSEESEQKIVFNRTICGSKKHSDKTKAQNESILTFNEIDSATDINNDSLKESDDGRNETDVVFKRKSKQKSKNLKERDNTDARETEGNEKSETAKEIAAELASNSNHEEIDEFALDDNQQQESNHSDNNTEDYNGPDYI